jgi:hypothetical protein
MGPYSPVPSFKARKTSPGAVPDAPVFCDEPAHAPEPPGWHDTESVWTFALSGGGRTPGLPTRHYCDPGSAKSVLDVADDDPAQ